MKHPFSFSLRLMAFCTALIFGWNQIVYAGETLPKDYVASPAQPVVTAPAFGSATPTVTSPVQTFTTTDFLSNKQGPLSPATQDTQEIVPRLVTSPDSAHYEYERYDFQDAFDLLRPEFASAVIVKEITAGDLKKLAELPFETGVIVLHGEIVLFTSGNADEIGVLSATKELTGKSNFISHTHGSIYSREGPSGDDINQAVQAPGAEYVITDTGVYTYNNEGVLNNGDPFSYDWYLSKLEEAMDASKEECDQIEARKDLNRFIAAQDEYNLAKEDERETFRRGGTLSYYASGLTSVNVTTLPGSPYPYIAAGSTAATKLSVSSNQFAMGYSVPGVSDNSGFTISFDNASTSAIETQNLSTQTYLAFGFRGPNTSVTLEIIDVNGVKDTFTLTHIVNTAERFWRIPVSSILNTLDKTRIKQLNFIVAQANTTLATRSGTLYVRSNGLNVNAPAQPVVTSTVSAVTNQTTLTVSGTKEANTSILINGVEVVARNAFTTWSAILNLSKEGNNVFSITAKNSISKVSTAKSITVLRDRTAPTGSLNINSGALYAASATVTLNLSGSDSGSKVGTMSFSTDGANWTAPIAYATSKTFTFPAGDGRKTVYVKYYDKAGNVSAVYSKSIILDTLPPSGTIKVNNGAQFINKTAVMLNLSAIDAGSGLSKMRFSSNGTTWSTAETYAATKAWTFAAGDGNKTVYVKFLDRSGKWSTPVSTTVTLDSVKPAGSININSGAAYTNTANVTLNLSGIDSGSGVGTMSFSTDNVTWTAAEVYATSKNITLPAGTGTKTAYVKFYDRAGNISAVYSKAIFLDTTVPTGSVTINSGAIYTTSSAVTLSLSATDTGAGLDKMSFSTDNVNWTTAEAYATSKALILPAGDGSKTVYVKYFDKAGNASAIYSKSIILDTLPPTGTIKVNDGTQFISQTAATLNLSAVDFGAGLDKMSFSSDKVTWTTSEAYAVTRSWTFAAGDGNKTVYVKFSDKTGQWSALVSVTVMLDSVKPTGSIDINSGAAYTNTANVTLNLSGSDSGSGIASMSFSTDNANWSAPEAYASSRAFTLSSGDGSKTIYVKYFDKAGNVSATFSKAITLDTAMPTGSISINSGSLYTSSTTVTLNLSGSDSGSGIDKISFSTDSVTWSNQEVYASSRKFALFQGDGNKTVYVKYYDRAGNVSAVYSKSIVVDTTVPSGSMKINNDIAYTNASSVTLNLTGSDVTSGIDQMRFSADEGATWSDWEEFSGTKSFALLSGDGTKTVTAQLRDKAGLVSLNFSDLIILDTTTPEGLLNINSGAAYTNTANVTLNLSGSDSGSGIASMSFSTDNANWSAPEAYVSSSAFTLSPGDGSKTIYVKYFDKAGNVSPAYSKFITLDTVSPTGSLAIHNDAGQTTTREVTLTLTGTDALSGVSQMRFSLDSGTTWTGWEPFAATKALTLSGANGNKTVQYQLSDAAGNFSEVDSRSITLNINTTPIIQFTSAAAATHSDYVLTYTVNGTARSERWQLSAGVNPLLVRVPGDPSTFTRFDVALDQPDITVPDMPSIPVLAEGLISVTAQNGLIVKYDGTAIVSVENPGVFRLFLPQFDANGALTDGVLQFSNGDKLLYQNARPVLKVTTAGEKTVYNNTGTVNSVVEPDGTRVRFSYRIDDQGKVLSVLSKDTSATSLYEEGIPSRIVMADGSDIRYENGLLSSYRDASGNVYQYQITELQTSGAVTGYTSVLSMVTPAGSASGIPFSQVAANLSQYPAIQSALNDKISTRIDYDANSKMTKFTSGKGEVLTLHNQLPASLSDASGNFKLFENTLNASGGLSSVALTQENVPSQIFDADGNIRSITLSDGTVFQVTENKLGTITISDGSVLTGLRWNAETQIMTDYVRTYADGTKTTYVNSRMVRKEEPGGNITTFIFLDGIDQPDLLTTPDGRTYHYISYQNAQGLWDRRTELVKIVLPDGSRVEFENGKPVRYIQMKEVLLDAEAVPVLPNGQAYIPSLAFPEVELRGITIDASGNILSGEILYQDGTQHFIKNGQLYKQITPFGQTIEFNQNFNNAWSPVQPVAPQPLTSEELAYRNQLLEGQLDFFTKGIGLHERTGLPLDNYQGEGHPPADYSQATLVGFWAEILVAIAAGDYVTTKMTRQEAFQKLEDLLNVYRQAQVEAGWNGMLAFFTIVETEEPVLDEFGNPTGQTRVVVHYKNSFDQFGFGDTLNLSVSLSTVIGALQGLAVDPSLQNYRSNILSQANTILGAQEAGYAAFYDPAKKRFHGAYTVDSQNGSGQFVKDYYIDRVFNEFRTGLIWLASKYPQYREAIDHIDVAYRSSSELVENVAPWDGGAFQMFWPQIHVDETQYPEFAVALRNFLYTQAEFVKTNGIPGLLSAGADPEQGYEGKIGVPSTAETDDPLHADIGSLYGLASAFSIAPHYVLQFFKNIETAVPGIRTRAGWVDSITYDVQTVTDPVTGEKTTTRTPVLSTEYFGVDQASFMLSLLGTSRNYFSNYLDQTNIKNSFDGIYRSFKFNLTPFKGAFPEPPDLGAQAGILYNGVSANPDGSGYDLVKEEGFISLLLDPDYGEGHVYNYRTPGGAFHHTEIEFTAADGTVTSMGLQEFLLLPDRGEVARSIFEEVSLDLFDEASAQGGFYTPGHGFANGALTYMPPMGQVHRVQFEFQKVTQPVGTWAQFQGLDLSKFDFVSVPIKLDSDTSAAMRLKFELKGMGEVFITPQLTHDWQYIQIPIRRPAPALNEIAVVVQSMDGSPIEGEFLMGPLSAFKVRTSNNIDWQSLLGKSDAELKNLLKTKALAQPQSGGVVTREEVLEDFTIDSEGKLVSGTLKKANGEIQYYQRGALTKWVFPNGRTVLFENGLATFAIDLARGQLEESRFYYDQDLRGQIRSFVIQENDRKRAFNARGELELLVEGGSIVHFQNGAVSSIETPAATLTNMTFGEDQRLLTAHVTTKSGAGFDIDQTGEQSVVFGDGVELFYSGRQITAIKTLQNGRAELSYSYDAVGRMIGVNVSFQEAGKPSPTVVSLADFLNRPGHELERTHLLEIGSVDLIAVSSVNGYSVGSSVSSSWVDARKQSELYYNGWVCTEPVCWNFGYDASSPTIGMALSHGGTPVDLSKHDFLSITMRLDPSVSWSQDFVLSVKDGYWARYSYAIEGLTSAYQTFTIPLAGKSWISSQLTLEIQPLDRVAQAYSKMGKIFIEDVSYFSVQTPGAPLWETQAGITDAQIQGLKLEADDLSAVGSHIASKTPLQYANLAAFMDMPSLISYSDKDVSHRGQLTGFKRFDGAEVSVSGSNVTKVILPDGTVNEYSSQGNVSQGTIQDPSGTGPQVGSLDYHYGELRKITQSDGKIYELRYEFDALGDQITLIEDCLTGDVRRFKDGKLIQSVSDDGVSTTYEYQNGELIAAELFYKNRVLQSSSYQFSGGETQVTDDNGTTWYYDANGNLKKHLTKDGYLYAYSDYSATPQDFLNMPQDFKWANVYNATGLRAVSLIGYEAKDGMQVQKGDDGLVGIDSPAGDKAVNVVLDDERKIKSGQIQFANGLVLEIENYLPVRGRLAGGSLFSTDFPAGSVQTTLLQDSTGSYTGSMFQIDGTHYSYDAYGFLRKIASPNGESYQFTYQKDASGNATGYDRLHHQQVAFNGVPFPAEMTIEAGNDLVLSGPSGVLAKREGGAGFIVGAYDESLNQWKVLSGQFLSDGDRILLRNFLEDLKAGQYVAMAVNDPDFSKAGDEILALLEGIGAGQVRTASAVGQAWYLFGNEYMKKGEGREQVGGSSFSTVTENMTHGSLAGVSDPIFNGAHLILSAPKAAADAYGSFLRAYEPNKPNGDLDEITVYDKENQIVYSENVNGIRTFYDEGKPRETYTSGGELLYTHEYGCPAAGCPDPDDPYLSRVTLVKARLDFEAESAKARQQIEQVKFDALEQLAEQENVAKANIKQEVAASIAALNTYISQLQSQRYRKVKSCHKGWFGIGNFCEENTYEVPGVAGMISEAQNQKVELLRNIQPGQIATIPALIAQKKLEIEAATAQKMADLTAQERSVFHDMLEREVAPVLADIYRRLLGRDPSAAEVDAEIARFGTVQAIDLDRTVTEIRNSNEFQNRTNDKAAIIGQVRTFLNAYVAAANDPAARAGLAQSLMLDPSEVVALNQEEVTAIISWLEARDLHFGQSAFLSLKNMLASRGIDVPMVALGYETILVDILTGTINKFTEGDLVISVFAFQRVAKLHGADITGVRYALADLKNLYQSVCGLQSAGCSLRVIAHVEGNHFVVITAVTSEGVTFFETNKGPAGGLVTETFDQFMKIWDTGNGTGHLVVYKDQAMIAKTIDDKAAMRIRGAFFGIDDLIFWFAVASIVLTAASVVVSYISPAFGKILGYAAMVAGIVAIAASVVNFAVQGFQMALNATKGLTLLQSIQKGFTALGSAIWEGVAHVGQFLKQGFTFLTDVFTGGFSSLGAGITKMSTFVVDGIGLPGAKLTFGQMVGRNMIAAAINIPVSKGLEGLGIDPRMARLAGAFVSGGMAGLGAGATGFLQSGVQAYLLQGVSEIGLKLNLPPPITAALSTAVTGSLLGMFNGDFTLKAALPTIFPQFTQQLTLGGIELLGRSLGLDPRITSLIGLPIAAAVGGVTRDLLNPNGMTSLWQSIQNAVLSREVAGGILSLSASIAVHQLGLDQSLLGSLSSRLVAGMFNDFLASPKRFDFVDSIIKSTDESFYEFFNPVLLPQLFASVMDHGLADGIEQYATMLFTKETINEFVSAGLNLGEWIARGLPTAEDIIYEGESAKRLKLAQNGKTINFIYQPKGEKLELQMIYEEYSNGRKPRLVEFETDDQGKIVRAFVIEQMADGTFRRDALTPAGEVQEVTFRDWNGETYGRLSFNAAGGLEFTNYNLGISDHLSQDGQFTFDFTASPDFQDLNQLLYDFNANLSPEDVAHLVTFTYGNGFWNSHESPDSVSTLMAAFIEDTITDKARNGTPSIVLFEANGDIARDRHGNILTTASLPVTLYEETGLVGNVLRWAAETWFGCNFMRDEVEGELIRYFDLIDLNQREFGLDPNMSFVHFAHSGDFQPMIEALEHMPDEYRSRIKTMIVYEGPYVGDGVINDPYLQTLIRVRGSKEGLSVPFLGHRHFEIVDKNGAVIPLPNQYNIEIVGAGHSDFSYDPAFEYGSEEEREIARKTSLFMRDLNLIANDKTDLEYLLTSNLIPGVHYDSTTKLITVNPNEYVSPNGDR